MGQKESKTKEKVYESQGSVFQLKEMVQSKSVGTIDKEFEMLERIGEGSFGYVIKAKCKRTRLLRAIKVVSKKKSSQIERVLLNEFDLLRETDHPNILQTFDFYEDAFSFFIVTELLQGQQLFDIFRHRKVFSEAFCFPIFQQICRAVAYLHCKKIMHRDIKLENIVYDQKNNYTKLIDLGSSCRFESDEPCPRGIVGSANYLAPEVLNKCYNQKCDVWSLGILLFAMLSGNTPFLGESNEEIFQGIKTNDFDFKDKLWESISKEAKQLIRAMLEKNPRKRISLAEVIGHPWMQAMQGSVPLSQSQHRFVLDSLANMQRFKVQAGVFQNIKIAEIQVGVLVFMVNFICNIPHPQLALCFNLVDQDADGVLSIKEISDALVENLDMKVAQAKALSEDILHRIDFNNSKSLDYSSMNLNEILTEQNLKKTFCYIDTDESGTLSAAEIQAKLGNHVSQDYYKKLIKQFSLNQAGEITLKDFVSKMRDLLKNY